MQLSIGEVSVIDIDMELAKNSPPIPTPAPSTPHAPEALISMRREDIPTKEEEQSTLPDSTDVVDLLMEESRIAKSIVDRADVRSIIGKDPGEEFSRFIEQCLQEPVLSLILSGTALSLILKGSALVSEPLSGEAGRPLVAKGNGKIKAENASDRTIFMTIENDLRALSVDPVLARVAGRSEGATVESEVRPKGKSSGVTTDGAKSDQRQATSTVSNKRSNVKGPRTEKARPTLWEPAGFRTKPSKSGTKRVVAVPSSHKNKRQREGTEPDGFDADSEPARRQRKISHSVNTTRSGIPPASTPLPEMSSSASGAQDIPLS